MTRKVHPIWEWTFDRAVWPEKSFFGRRWVEFWRGDVVQPANGCIYFWICVAMTAVWGIAKVVAVGRFILGPFRSLMRRRSRRVASPIVQQSVKPVQYVPARIQVERYEDQKAKFRFLLIIGRVLHFILLTKYSPFRLLGRGLLVVLVLVDRFLKRNENAVFPVTLVMFTIAVLGLIVTAFLEEPIITAIVLGSVFVITVLLVLLKLFLDSEIGRVGIGMAVATKDRFCPGIKVIDSRSGSSTSAA